MLNWRKPVIQTLLTLSGSDIWKNYQQIQKFAQCDRKKIQAYQEQQLKKLLLHAADNVPYYSNILKKHNVVANNTVKLDNFRNLPYLTKNIIRNNWDNIQSTDSHTRSTYENTSGGSTGEPLRLIQDQYYSDWNIANKLFYAKQVGKEPGENELKLWGSERDILEGSIGLRETVQNFLYNRTFHNAFRMTKNDMKSFIGKLNRVRPVYIWAYVDSAFEVAKYIIDNQLDVYSPKSIVVTAGVMSEKMRKTIEKAFKTDVYNQYGTREVGDIAAEGPDKNGLYIFEWTHYVEVIEKKIFITLLTNYSMPLIRYQIGDTAKLIEKIPEKGVKVQRFKNITGRITDHFIKKDGTLVHGEYFTHVFYFKDWVKKFKVVQEDYDHVICYVVKRSKPDTDDIQKIKTDIKKVMGTHCKVDVVYKGSIQPTYSGKYIYTESKVI